MAAPKKSFGEQLVQFALDAPLLLDKFLAAIKGVTGRIFGGSAGEQQLPPQQAARSYPVDSGVPIAPQAPRSSANTQFSATASANNHVDQVFSDSKGRIDSSGKKFTDNNGNTVTSSADMVFTQRQRTSGTSHNTGHYQRPPAFNPAWAEQQKPNPEPESHRTNAGGGKTVILKNTNKTSVDTRNSVAGTTEIDNNQVVRIAPGVEVQGWAKAKTSQAKSKPDVPSNKAPGLGGS